MKYSLLSVILCALSLNTFAASPIGRVTCGNRGVEHVVVSDGEFCTRTDRNGNYRLPENRNARFIFLSTPSGYTSQQEGAGSEFYKKVTAHNRRYDFKLQAKGLNENQHGFIVTADPQLYAEKEFSLLKQATEDIRNTVQGEDRPFHGICVGDITSGNHAFYEPYKQAMATTGLEFRHAMGNHDMKLWGRSYETSLSAFEETFGPTYYSFNVGTVHYIVLNDNFYIGRDWYYIGYLDERQLQWLERDLSYVEAGSTVVLALHIPTMFNGKGKAPFRYQEAEESLTNYNALYTLLKPYMTHILSGHMHTTTNLRINEHLYEHNIAALCGAWWQGSICTDGTPAGYAVFEVDGDRIAWYYRATGHPKAYQLKIYTEKDDPSFAGQVVANVWNCDDKWQVTMQTDNGAWIPMQRITAIDPEARTLYADTSKLDHKWITVTPSDHYFTAPIPDSTHVISIRAIDSFGNRYQESRKVD